MASLNDLPIKPPRLTYVDREGPEPLFCPVCGAVVADDSAPCDRCKRTIIACAIGRILRMGARPTQPGDLAEFERCRRIVIDLSGGDLSEEFRLSWARDRNKGAQGD